jgi:hypothetical protein
MRTVLTHLGNFWIGLMHKKPNEIDRDSDHHRRGRASPSGVDRDAAHISLTTRLCQPAASRRRFERTLRR